MEKIINKKFNCFLKKNTGRNNTGRITLYKRGAGVKSIYKLIDRKMDVFGIPFKVISEFKYPGISARVARICYSNGLLSNVLLSSGSRVGDILINNDYFKYSHFIYENNSIYKIGQLNVGDKIFNIENFPGSGSVFCRSAGSYGIIMKRIGVLGGTIVKLRSGNLRFFFNSCLCMKGVNSNVFHKYDFKYKAGQMRWLGRRPTVRGVAMNPIDHPHGGGEGKTSGGRCSVSPWGVLTKGYKTKKVKYSVFKL